MGINLPGLGKKFLDFIFLYEEQPLKPSKTVWYNTCSYIVSIYSAYREAIEFTKKNKNKLRLCEHLSLCKFYPSFLFPLNQNSCGHLF
jgi:hypothetical protein